MPLYEITEQSQKIEEFDMAVSRQKEQLEQEIKKSMMQSSQDAIITQMTGPTRSGELPTNPTFVSVY